MAEEPWNRVHVPFPSAVSSVRIPFNIATDTTVKRIVEENGNIVKLLTSEVLQTEIRVLYELLYVLNNSFRQHKSLRVIRQVEQCINRLKEMKLDATLLDLIQLCPKSAQRKQAILAGQCDVPSQPMLEWICLKVLGAAGLMACLLHHCKRAFILIRQHLRWAEFIVLNVVLSSMISRLWAFFKGILGSLVPLYQKLLNLLKEVSQAHPMSSLPDFTLPPDVTAFLGAPDPSLLTTEPPRAPKGRVIKVSSRSPLLSRLFRGEGGERRTQPVVRPGAGRARRTDLGKAVSLQRTGDSGVPGFDVKALLKRAHEGVSDLSVEQEPWYGQKKMFLERIEAADTFRDLVGDLEELMRWCECQKLKLEKRRLAFLRLRCQRFSRLETLGHSVQWKLRSYKQEVSWALTLRRAPPRTCQCLKNLWRNAHPRTRYQPLRTRLCINRKRPKRHRKRTGLSSLSDPLDNVSKGNSMFGSSRSQEEPETSVQNTSSVNKDDIDDIFASLGF